LRCVVSAKLLIFAIMETLIIPPYLNRGDSIGIVAPARSITENEIGVFVGKMKELGIDTVLGKYLFGKQDQYSGTIEERLSDLHDMLINPAVKAVFAARGGYGSAQLLPGLDIELLRQHPTWLVGFSDMTAIHCAVNKSVASIHGVMPYSFAMDNPQDEWSFESMRQVLFGDELDYHHPGHSLNFPGEVKGMLTGGNLSVLYSLAGTPYEPNYEGKILFLEDLDEYLYHIDRMILNFELRGVFELIAGLVVGDYSDMHDNTVPFGKKAYDIIADRAHKYKVPCMFGFPAGHQKSNQALIFGRQATLSVKSGESSLRM
jgi:muramoyltetrapeptide carboxypeptidase